jgi:transposase-like protein
VKPKLTEEQLVAIVLDPRGVEDVAREHGIAKSTVSRIRNGLRHKSETEVARKKLERKEQLLSAMEKVVEKFLGQVDEWRAEDERGRAQADDE